MAMMARGTDREKPPRSRPEKVQRIVAKCVYDIATGAWRRGRRLPSVRDAEHIFGCHHLTILRAYRELVRLGIVESVPRSGFFVRDTPSVRRISAYQPALEKLCERFSEELRSETGLLPSAAFRYLAHLSAQRAETHPEVAFVECTDLQASGHAAEVTARLETPCLALTTEDLASDGQTFPTSVRTLITTSFHLAELASYHRPPELSVTDVAIEMSEGMVDQLRGAKRVLFVSLVEENAQKIAADAVARLGETRPEYSAMGVDTADLPALLRKSLGGRKCAGTVLKILLSTSHWEAIPQEWDGHPDIVQLQYTICETEWPRIAAAIGVPVVMPVASDPQVRRRPAIAAG